MLYIGWVAAAFLSGVLLMSGLNARARNRQSLHERFDDLGTTLGRSYAAILAAVRAQPLEMRRDEDGRTVRVWREGGYSIALLFDAYDSCLGVLEEID